MEQQDMTLVRPLTITDKFLQDRRNVNALCDGLLAVAGRRRRRGGDSEVCNAITFVIRHHPICGNLNGHRVGLLAEPFYSRLSMSSTEPTVVAEGKAAENSLRRS